MGIIIWIITGVFVGFVVSVVVGVGRRQDAMPDIIASSAGAVAGGFIASYLRGSSASEFELYSFASALLGACVLIVIVRMFRNP